MRCRRLYRGGILLAAQGNTRGGMTCRRLLHECSRSTPHAVTRNPDQMPGLIKHRGVRIVTLEPGDTVAGHARPGDIMIEQRTDGWYLHFIADDGSVDSYEDPFDSQTKALWSAKAAAEYQASGE